MRLIVLDAALRLAKRGYRFALQSHDELAFVVPTDRLEEAKTIIMQEMTRPPAWMPELPLHAEIGVGNNYGEVR
jgi:DNA polymerase I-like protein with 3'-5' exonuclease and polymerase domains